MNAIPDLMAHFANAPDGLSPQELEALTSAVEADPQLAVELKEQLLLADLLAQRMSGDRQEFASRVRQRIREWDRAGSSDRLRSHRSRPATERHSEPRRRSRGGVWIAGTAAVAALLLAVLLLWQRETPPQIVASIEALAGDATLIRDGEPLPVNLGDGFQAGDRIETARRARLTVGYPDGTRVELSEHTHVVVEPVGRGKRVVLQHGELSARIALQPADAPMVFDTPHAEATVLGTALAIEAGPRQTRVAVSQGRVEVRHKTDGTAVVVAAGEQAVAAPGHALVPRPQRHDPPPHPHGGHH